MILFNLIFFLLQPVQANYLDHVFLTEPEIVVKRDDGSNVPVASVCTGMKYNYLQEMTRLRDLKAQLDWAVQQPLTDQQSELVKNLRLQLQQSANRLAFLARPEWNDELLSFYLRWQFPQGPGGGSKNLEKIEVTSLYYKDEPAGNLAPLLIKSDRFLQYESRGTYLEVCQFISTLEIEVNVQYRWYHAFCPDENDPEIRRAFLNDKSTPALQNYLACLAMPSSRAALFLKGRAP